MVHLFVLQYTYAPAAQLISLDGYADGNTHTQVWKASCETNHRIMGRQQAAGSRIYTAYAHARTNPRLLFQDSS